MYGFGVRRLGRVAAVGLALISGACGGEGGATGPGGGDGVAGTYVLVGINDMAVPAVAQMEHCTPSAFYGGSVVLAAGGNWQMAIELEDETGQHVLHDHGRYQRDGDDLEFISNQYGDRFEGEVGPDAVALYYDFCSNGEHDIDFIFER